MRVMGQRRSPGVQHAGHADARAKVAGIGGDRGQRLRRCPKQQVVDGLLVPIGDLRDRRGDGEDNMEILDRQQVFGTGGHPIPRRGSLALRAVPVLAGIIGDVLVAALGTGGHMPAERLGSAGFDRRHDLELGQADMPGIGPPPRRAIAAKDVGDLQSWPDHCTGATPARVGTFDPATSSGSRTD